MAYKNAGFDVTKDKTVEKARNNVTLTMNDIIQGASLINSQTNGPTSNNATVNNALKDTAKALLQSLTTVNSSSNVDSQINVLNQLVKSNLLNSTDQTKIDNKISNMSANIKDVDSLGSYITLVQTQKNTTNKTQADQFSLFSNIVNSAKTVATSNLNNDNKVQGYTSGNLVGQNQYVNKS